MADTPTGVSLVEQVRKLDVPHGHLAVWALGQSGYLLKGGGRVVLIDPYLSNYVEEISGDSPGAFARLAPIAVPPGELSMVDVALSTHHHADHCDPRTLAPVLRASPQARILASYRGRDMLVEAGLDGGRIEVPPVGEAVSYGQGLSITAIPSAHYEFEPDAAGNPAYLGYIVNLNGVSLYHSGDSLVYDGLVERLKHYRIDIACLPINGRDWFREQQGIVGNMDYREAAELAWEIGAKVLIPGHNDMFASNRINPAYLLDYLTSRYPQQRVHFLRAGELYYFVSA